MFEKAIIVPLLAAFIGAMGGFIAALFSTRRIERFRRSARWEPYTTFLWQRQLELASQIARDSAESINIVFTFELYSKMTIKHIRATGREFLEHARPHLRNGERMLLFSTELNDQITRFFINLVDMFPNNIEKNSLPPDHLIKIDLPKEIFRKLWTNHVELLRGLQKELKIEAAATQLSDMLFAAQEKANAWGIRDPEYHDGKDGVQLAEQPDTRLR
jgi:hypothetical protein